MLMILQHTPHWVFGLFVGLFFFGVQQTRSRQVKKYLAYLLPLGMTLLSFAGVASSFGIHIHLMLIWLIGLGLVTYLLKPLISAIHSKYDRETNTFTLQGSWTPFVVIMLIFFTKYAVGVLNGMQVGWLHLAVTEVLLSLCYGGFSGYFIGRAIYLRKIENNAYSSVDVN